MIRCRNLLFLFVIQLDDKVTVVIAINPSPYIDKGYIWYAQAKNNFHKKNKITKTTKSPFPKQISNQTTEQTFTLAVSLSLQVQCSHSN